MVLQQHDQLVVPAANAGFKAYFVVPPVDGQRVGNGEPVPVDFKIGGFAAGSQVSVALACIKATY